MLSGSFSFPFRQVVIPFTTARQRSSRRSQGAPWRDEKKEKKNKNQNQNRKEKEEEEKEEEEEARQNSVRKTR